MQQPQTNRPLIEVGEKSPLWSAQSNCGEINLHDYLGQQALLLVFYPADWSSVCSDELPMLEELLKLSGDLALQTFGISVDSPACHKAFAHQIGLQNILLVSDRGHEISQLYGLLDEDGMCKRATVLVDPTGIVRWVRVEPDRGQPRPLAEMERALQQVREWNGLDGSLAAWKKERQFIMQLQRDRPLATPTALQLRFWGTRGSIPVSGVDHLRYGGNTSCVSLTSDTGHLFIFDCGSGARELGNYLLSSGWPTASGDQSGSPSPLSGYILLSHTHWDHIQGFPFFGPVFKPGNRFNIIGWSNCSQTLTSILAGQMEQIYFPVSLYALPSELSFYSMQYGPASLDGGKVKAALLKHPLPSTCYRLELGGKTIVYATDHEPRSLPAMLEGHLLGDDVIDPHLVEMAHQADVLIHDAQYSVAELSQKVGWGHNSAEVAVDTALRAGVKMLVLYHHDPAHDDDTIDSLLEAAQQRAASFGEKGRQLQIIAASDGLALDL